MGSLKRRLSGPVDLELRLSLGHSHSEASSHDQAQGAYNPYVGVHPYTPNKSHRASHLGENSENLTPSSPWYGYGPRVQIRSSSAADHSQNFQEPPRFSQRLEIQPSTCQPSSCQPSSSQPALELSLATANDVSSQSPEPSLRSARVEDGHSPLSEASGSPPSLKLEGPDIVTASNQCTDWNSPSLPYLVPLSSDGSTILRRLRRKNPSHKYDSDGHAWRKYSHKMIQATNCERIYYACVEKGSSGCTARKMVDRPKNCDGAINPEDEKVTVDGVHNHLPGRVQMTGLP